MVLRLTAAATHGFTMVSFIEAVSRRNTFVGGTCDPPSTLLVTSDKGRGKCVCPRLYVCMSVCLSVSKITQKRVYEFG